MKLRWAFEALAVKYPATEPAFSAQVECSVLSHGWKRYRNFSEAKYFLALAEKATAVVK